MTSIPTSGTDVRERKALILGEQKAATDENTVCGQATNEIGTFIANLTLIRFIAFMYRVIILILLVGIGVAVAMAAKEMEHLAHHMASPATCGPPCPRYWIGYEGKCYYFSKEKKNWTYSQKFCSLHNASLARIESEEMEFVMRLKGKDIHWIGLRRLPGQPWAWSDGENSAMEVSGGGGDCAYLDNEAKAISSGCHTKLPCICSKPAAYINPSETPDP